jgi:hypothetical protein
MISGANAFRISAHQLIRPIRANPRTECNNVTCPLQQGEITTRQPQTLVQNPQDTILILISDLFEGGNREEMLQRVAALSTSGVQMIALLALSDRGAPAFDHNIAATLASFGIPAFASTPDRFPDLMAAAIERRDLVRWAADEDSGKVR